MTLLCAVVLYGSAYAESPELRFSKDGKFKIVQFTDVHFDLSTEYRRAQAGKTLAMMDYMLSTEKPDLVMFTGDVVTGEPAAEGWGRILDAVKKHQVPFCVVLGNHDAEQDISRADIGRIVTAYPGSLNTLTETGELADAALGVKGAKGVAAVLYCLDSHDYSTLEGVDGYGWFTQEQIAWYRSLSARFTKANDTVPLPSLAFFHIALPEYVAAWRNPGNTRIGRAAEDECPGALNPGMFAAMKECGDVMGVFVGHDHDIDYLVAEKGIALGYGRFSGDDTTYNNLRPGVRVLVLSEGEHGFESWIREGEGRIVDHVVFGRDGRIYKEKNKRE